MYERYQHQLLLAIAQDYNRKILPIAFSIMPEESEDDWDFFLTNLRRHVVPQPDICIISNRGTEIQAAIDQR